MVVCKQQAENKNHTTSRKGKTKTRIDLQQSTCASSCQPRKKPTWVHVQMVNKNNHQPVQCGHWCKLETTAAIATTITTTAVVTPASVIATLLLLLSLLLLLLLFDFCFSCNYGCTHLLISLLKAVALISRHMPTENSFAITSQVSIMQKDRKSMKGIHN